MQFQIAIGSRLPHTHVPVYLCQGEISDLLQSLAKWLGQKQRPLSSAAAKHYGAELPLMSLGRRR